jgi:hypothetical protein
MFAQAGIQGEQAVACGYPVWIPTLAGMTPARFTHQRGRVLRARIA